MAHELALALLWFCLGFGAAVISFPFVRNGGTGG